MAAVRQRGIPSFQHHKRGRRVEHAILEKNEKKISRLIRVSHLSHSVCHNVVKSRASASLILLSQSKARASLIKPELSLSFEHKLV